MSTLTLVEQFQQTLIKEANAIHQASKQIPVVAIAKALDILSNCQGKVILIGVGKSGIIAQKIAATLTSVGTLAVYLHSADALHGDFGIVTPKDVAILLSNSGETEEIIEIIPSLKYRQVPIIAIVGNLYSTLAKKATVILDSTVESEACPLNLAPTSSTTVALAIGDALAMTLMQKRGITSDDFALNHPGGRLGKRLILRVQDLMHSEDKNPTLFPDASWLEVVSKITQGGMGAVNIINNEGCLLGIITDGDLRRWIEQINPVKLQYFQAEKLMTINPIAVHPETLAYDALKLMEERSSQISVLSVVDENKRCLGLLRLHDIVRSGLG